MTDLPDLVRLRRLAGITPDAPEKLAILLPQPSNSNAGAMGELLDKLREIWDEPDLKFHELTIDGVRYLATAVHRDY